MDQHTMSEVQRLAIIIKPRDMGTFDVNVIAGFPDNREIFSTKYYEVSFNVGKSALETEDGLDSLFEVAKDTLKGLLDGHITLQEQGN